MASVRLQMMAIPLVACGFAIVCVSLWGDSDLLTQVMTALGICLAPSLLQLFHQRRVHASQDWLLVLARSMIWRLGVTLAASLALGLALPEQFREAFWITLLVGYQLVLATETWAMYREQTQTAR